MYLISKYSMAMGKYIRDYIFQRCDLTHFWNMFPDALSQMQFCWQSKIKSSPCFSVIYIHIYIHIYEKHEGICVLRQVIFTINWKQRCQSFIFSHSNKKNFNKGIRISFQPRHDKYNQNVDFLTILFITSTGIHRATLMKTNSTCICWQRDHKTVTIQFSNVFLTDQ